MAGLSRRNFLSWASAAGLLSLTGCVGNKSSKPKSNANAKVVILGGGFAGATAAKHLKMLAPAVKATLIERNNYYLACPGSNEVVASLKRPKELRFGYRTLVQTHGIESLTGEASGIDSRRRSVAFADGSEIPYDRLILAPGIDFRWDAIEGYDEAASFLVPHAWKAGPQTTLLRRQLRGMPNGGVVVIVAPENPYRCPPGPYERASLIAHFLTRFKPRSKVLVLDAKSQFSEQSLFEQGWKELYPGMVEWISIEREGGIKRIEADRRIVHGRLNKHRADVLNVIPPQKAGKLAQAAGLVDASGWCPVDPRTFESTLAPGIHIIGDACIAPPMPKSAFAANSQAKVCAAAVLDLLAENEPAAPRLTSHCYSFLNPEHAISASEIYEYSGTEKRLTALSTGKTPPYGNWREEAEQARSWHSLFMREVFG